MCAIKDAINAIYQAPPHAFGISSYISDYNSAPSIKSFNQWRTQISLTELYHGLLHRLILREQRTNADTELLIVLRNRINQHHILLDGLQIHNQNVRKAVLSYFLHPSSEKRYRLYIFILNFVYQW